jgi:hypothetical protein
MGMSFPVLNLDQLIVAFDNSLRTVFVPARAARPDPASGLSGGNSEGPGLNLCELRREEWHGNVRTHYP